MGGGMTKHPTYRSIDDAPADLGHTALAFDPEPNVQDLLRNERTYEIVRIRPGGDVSRGLGGFRQGQPGDVRIGDCWVYVGHARPRGTR